MGWSLVGCGRCDDQAPRRTDPVTPVATPPTPPTPPTAVASEWYRAVVGSGVEEVPFFLRTPAPGTGGGCTIVNGEERLEADCRWEEGAHLEIEFPMFATSIEATRDADGALHGTWQLSRISGATAPARFAATRIAGPDPQLRFPAAGTATTAPASFAGTWRFEFAAFEAGKGEFAQTPDGIVTGTIIPRAIGDMRYLAGNARGNTLQLSTFDGQHAYVIRAELTPGEDTLTGTWIYASIVTDPFTARRVPEVDIAVTEKIRLRPGATRVTIPQLDETIYGGKPVIVDYFGTWCPACIDETPFLVELYRRYHPDGLEILSIALEGTTDDAYNQRQVDHFRTKYGITWRIVVVSGELGDTDFPPELEGTGGYPVTIFLDRDRAVRAVHSGFIGPAAGEEHRRLTARFEAHVRGMLASPPAPSPPP